jgi:MinD-like ATPase involved in chromosome partitioning or flagellar assembly
MSQIITFYSYKGGVGRSMALANVATLLSKWGKRVLMIDWDLEAPGLEKFFRDYLTDVQWDEQKGVLEWLTAQQKGEVSNWKDWVIPFRTSESKADLHLLVSGKSNGDYAENLRDFNVAKFYEQYNGGHIIENLRDELLAAYDYVLIDSRTGVTDFGGICTIQLPDILVMLFTPTEQALHGTEKIAKRILDSHKKLPFDRFRLLVCPVPSRFDSNTEFKESRDWLGRIAEKLEWLYDEWLPAGINLNEFLQIIKIPYISYFSFGEKLPVIEQGVSDPAGLGYAHENLTMLVANRLENVDLFFEQREKYLQEVSGEEPQEPGSSTLSDEIKRVRIYVAYSQKDETLRDELVNQIKAGVNSYNIEFLSAKPIPLGYSRKAFFRKNILKSDIILLLVTSNYTKDIFNPLGEISGASPEAIDEYSTIALHSSKLIIPIYFDLVNIFTFPTFLSDRSGVNVAFGTKPIKTYETILQHILPVIESKIQEKLSASLLAF